MPVRDVLPRRYVHPVDDVNDVGLESDRTPAAVLPPAARMARLVVYMSTTAILSAGTSLTPEGDLIRLRRRCFAAPDTDPSAGPNRAFGGHCGPPLSANVSRGSFARTRRTRPASRRPKTVPAASALCLWLLAALRRFLWSKACRRARAGSHYAECSRDVVEAPFGGWRVHRSAKVHLSSKHKSSSLAAPSSPVQAFGSNAGRAAVCRCATYRA